MKKTNNCVRCYKPATFWIGFVLDEDGNEIRAGWCHNFCFLYPAFKGQYTEKMGQQNED